MYKPLATWSFFRGTTQNLTTHHPVFFTGFLIAEILNPAINRFMLSPSFPFAGFENRKRLGTHANVELQFHHKAGGKRGTFFEYVEEKVSLEILKAEKRAELSLYLLYVVYCAVYCAYTTSKHAQHAYMCSSPPGQFSNSTPQVYLHKPQSSQSTFLSYYAPLKSPFQKNHMRTGMARFSLPASNSTSLATCPARASRLLKSYSILRDPDLRDIKAQHSFKRDR
jgi:hypothetical protein